MTSKLLVAVIVAGFLACSVNQARAEGEEHHAPKHGKKAAKGMMMAHAKKKKKAQKEEAEKTEGAEAAEGAPAAGGETHH